MQVCDNEQDSKLLHLSSTLHKLYLLQNVADFPLVNRHYIEHVSLLLMNLSVSAAD